MTAKVTPIAQRQRAAIEKRIVDWSARVRAFPTAEKLRLAADFLDRANELPQESDRAEGRKHAATIARLALSEMGVANG